MEVAEAACDARSDRGRRTLIPVARAGGFTTGHGVVVSGGMESLADVADRMDDLRRGADLGDRNPDDLRVAVTVRSCALEDGDRAREVARQ